jgi:hypothetical protein
MNSRRRRWPQKSGSPPLLELSLQVERNNAHNLELPGSRSCAGYGTSTLTVSQRSQSGYHHPARRTRTGGRCDALDVIGAGSGSHETELCRFGCHSLHSATSLRHRSAPPAGQLPTAFRRGSEECRRTCRRGRELRNTTLGKRSAPKKLQRSSRNSAAPPDPANEAASSSAACRPRARRSSARFCLCDYVAWDTAAGCQVMSSRSGTIDGASSRS